MTPGNECRWRRTNEPLGLHCWGQGGGKWLRRRTGQLWQRGTWGRLVEDGELHAGGGYHKGGPSGAVGVRAVPA